MKDDEIDRDQNIIDAMENQVVPAILDIKAPFFRDPKSIQTGISGWNEVLNDGEPKVEEHLQVVPEEKNRPADEGLLAWIHFLSPFRSVVASAGSERAFHCRQIFTVYQMHRLVGPNTSSNQYRNAMGNR